MILKEMIEKNFIVILSLQGNIQDIGVFEKCESLYIFIIYIFKKINIMIILIYKNILAIWKNYN